MQKVINVLAITSFIVSGAVVGGGVYAYLKLPEIIETAKENLAKSAVEAVSGALPGLIDAAMPKLPDATGGAIPGVPNL